MLPRQTIALDAENLVEGFKKWYWVFPLIVLLISACISRFFEISPTKVWLATSSIISLIIHRYITIPQCDQLPAGLITRLIKHCTCITELMGLNPLQIKKNILCAACLRNICIIIKNYYCLKIHFAGCVPCIGDQLTRIRFAGAKYLRAGAHTNKDRVDHLYPFQIAAWHTKRSFLKVPMIARYWIGRCPLTLGYYQIICARGQMLNPLHHLFWSKYKSHVQLSSLSPPLVHCHW